MVYVSYLISPISIEEVFAVKQELESVSREDRSAVFYDLENSLDYICRANVNEIDDAMVKPFNDFVSLFKEEQEQKHREGLLNSLRNLLAKSEDFYNEGEHRRYVFFAGQEYSEKQALKKAGMSHGDLMRLLKQLDLKRYKWSKDLEISNNEFEVGEDDGFYHLSLPKSLLN